ncbi:MAG: DUF3618 domain-containing protein [Rhodospirillaceae bacterium]
MTREIEDLEREIAETRADLDDALDMLQAKMTPSALLNQAFGHVHNNPSALSSSIGPMYAHKPFTALLLTAGLNWFLGKRAEKRAREEDREWQAYHPNERHRVRELAGRAKARVKASAARVRDRAADLTHRAHERADHARDEVHHLTDSARERMHTMSDGTRERMHEMRERGTERIHSLRERGSERVHGMMDSTRERSHRLSEKAREKMRTNKARATSFIDKQPLLAGAIALIAGAAIASMVPPTEPERRAAKPLAAKTKRLKARAKAKIVDGLERGTTMATEAIDNATTKIEEAMPGRQIH